MGSGCGDSIVEKSFVLRANSPSRWHLTRCLLLCSRITIHDFTGNVNTFFIDIERSIFLPGICRIILPAPLLFSAVFPTFRTYNVTT